MKEFIIQQVTNVFSSSNFSKAIKGTVNISLKTLIFKTISSEAEFKEFEPALS